MTNNPPITYHLSPITHLPCIILAGGKSSRMSLGNKALLPFKSEPSLTLYQYKKLTKIFQNVYISCKDKSIFDFEANFIEDGCDEFAPILAIKNCLETLKYQSIFFISVDTPFITNNIIEKLINKQSPKYDAIVAKSINKIEPLCGIYNISSLLQINIQIEKNNYKLMNLLDTLTTKYIEFNFTKEFTNINTKEDYHANNNEV